MGIRVPVALVGTQPQLALPAEDVRSQGEARRSLRARTVSAAASTVFASGADERYGYHLVNLIGSLKANSDVFDRVVAFDLGLSPHQRDLLGRLRGVEMRTVPPFAPHWSQGFTWKPWAWVHLDAGEIVFWLDAGSTVLRSLGPAIEQIEERGYFVVSQGEPLRNIVPTDYYARYGLS